ncbi:MAG: hypothetical protein ACKPKO_47305, partial [Candidatus Fonsibacter sp.]
MDIHSFLCHYAYAIHVFLVLNIRLNLNKVGRPLARIEGGTFNGVIVSISDPVASNADADDKDQNGLIKEFRELNIANDSKFQLPYTTKEREILYILYITGPSGSGTSTYTGKYLEPYVKQVQGQTHLLIF